MYKRPVMGGTPSYRTGGDGTFVRATSTSLHPVYKLGENDRNADSIWLYVDVTNRRGCRATDSMLLRITKCEAFELAKNNPDQTICHDDTLRIDNRVVATAEAMGAAVPKTQYTLTALASGSYMRDTLAVFADSLKPFAWKGVVDTTRSYVLHAEVGNTNCHYYDTVQVTVLPLNILDAKLTQTNNLECGAQILKMAPWTPDNGDGLHWTVKNGVAYHTHCNTHPYAPTSAYGLSNSIMRYVATGKELSVLVGFNYESDRNTALDFAFYLANGSFTVYYEGNPVTYSAAGSFSVGDVFTIVRDRKQVIFYVDQNGTHREVYRIAEPAYGHGKRVNFAAASFRVGDVMNPIMYNTVDATRVVVDTQYGPV
ncbi:MAG: hypothetical protein K2I83_01335, partial [Bacteroidales bacterium]|nr:hypothetical protein [Bacteroidales bacterium]